MNSHNAIDDVHATLSLLTYCRHKADEYTACQQELLTSAEIRRTVVRFRELYRDLYLHSYNRLYQLPTTSDATPSLIDELQYIYQQLLALQVVEPIEKWPHIINFLTRDLLPPNSNTAPSLRQQLDLHLIELNTLREADLCDSQNAALDERFFIATAHKAKGLEFDSVIVFNVTEGAYPYFFNIQSCNRERLREDARRFYVAISRAKKHLCITLAGMRNHNMSSSPSPFLRPISPLLTCFTLDPNTGKIAPVQQQPSNSIG